VGLLRKTSQLSNFAKKDIAIIPAAISDKPSIACFLVAQRGRASNALEDAGGSTQMGGTREKQHVATTTLDTMLDIFKTPDFIKIDIEGAELMAIQGADRLVADARPIFYIEVSSKSSTEIYERFVAADYSVFDQGKKQVERIQSANSFFVPSEKVESFKARVSL
jgi:FkbM family methyltransferase